MGNNTLGDSLNSIGKLNLLMAGSLMMQETLLIVIKISLNMHGILQHQFTIKKIICSFILMELNCIKKFKSQPLKKLFHTEKFEKK